VTCDPDQVQQELQTILDAQVGRSLLLYPLNAVEILHEGIKTHIVASFQQPVLCRTRMLVCCVKVKFGLDFLERKCWLVNF
jgi:hypothetical protein